MDITCATTISILLFIYYVQTYREYNYRLTRRHNLSFEVETDDFISVSVMIIRFMT